jgi:hypothetical protein
MPPRPCPSTPSRRSLLPSPAQACRPSRDHASDARDRLLECGEGGRAREVISASIVSSFRSASAARAASRCCASELLGRLGAASPRSALSRCGCAIECAELRRAGCGLGGHNLRCGGFRRGQCVGDLCHQCRIIGFGQLRIPSSARQRGWHFQPKRFEQFTKGFLHRCSFSSAGISAAGLIATLGSDGSGLVVDCGGLPRGDLCTHGSIGDEEFAASSAARAEIDRIKIPRISATMHCLPWTTPGRHPTRASIDVPKRPSLLFLRASSRRDRRSLSAEKRLTAVSARCPSKDAGIEPARDATLDQSAGRIGAFLIGMATSEGLAAS